MIHLENGVSFRVKYSRSRVKKHATSACRQILTLVRNKTQKTYNWMTLGLCTGLFSFRFWFSFTDVNVFFTISRATRNTQKHPSNPQKYRFCLGVSCKQKHPKQKHSLLQRKMDAYRKWICKTKWSWTMHNLNWQFFAFVLYYLNQFGWHCEVYCTVCLPLSTFTRE